MKRKFVLALVFFALTSSSILAQQPVTIHGTKTGEPISKYIYGQFIEHLGRSIYGGIWAEMLEDRKFYYPVTDEYNPWRTASEGGFWGGGDFPVIARSPWKVVGAENSVKMITESSFTGEQTPQVSLKGEPAGIEQLELALLKGKEYTGYVILAGDASAAPVTVQLLDEEENVMQSHSVESLSDEYIKHPFRFRSKVDAEHGRLRIVGEGEGVFRIGTVSLMPADNVKGFRADTLQLMKELNSPVYRWPGGNFVSDYNWKDGVGDRDKRPPRKNPAWTGIEPNDVGIHEFIELCGLLDTEPFVAVNTGLGSVELAAEQVEYCNGSVETPMGQWRAENGDAEPFGVNWWAVGNEMYGDWQKGHMPLEEYVEKHNRTAEAMYAVDPGIQLIAVGHVGEWSETMMRVCGDYMDLISEHIYHRVNDNLVQHVKVMPRSIRRVANAHREYRKTIDGLTEKDIRIAMDEWNYWYGQYKYGELGTQYFMQDGLGIAAGLHEYFRNSDIYFMANYAQTVNVIGAIKTSKTEAQMETTGLVLQLYRREFGEIPMRVSDVPDPLDIAAAWTPDRNAVTIGVVNPTEDYVDLNIDLKGAKLQEVGQKWEISGDDKMDHNEPGKPAKITIEERPAMWHEGSVRVLPLSVTLFKFQLK